MPKSISTRWAIAAVAEKYATVLLNAEPEKYAADNELLLWKAKGLRDPEAATKQQNVKLANV